VGHRRCVGTSRRPTARRRGILRHALEQLVEARSPQRAALVLTAERMPAHRHWQAPGTSILRPRWMRAWGVFSSLRLGGLFARVSPGSRSLGAAGWARRLAEPATECDWRPGLPGALTAGWARVAGLQAGQMGLGSHRAVRHCGRGGSDPGLGLPDWQPTQLRRRMGTLSGQILDYAYEGHKAANATSRASTSLNLASLESNRSMRHSRLGALQVVSYATTPVPVTREGAGANFGHIAQPLPHPSDP
jgi:hypothetical protein